MHIFQTIQLNCLVSFGTDIVNKALDVACQLAKSIVDVFPVEIVFDFGKDKFSCLLLFQRLSVSSLFLFLCSQKCLMLIPDVDFVVVDAKELVKHCLVGPGSH